MKLRAADLFCGAGGTSAGAHATGQAEVVFALNHWDRAIQTHSANFPNAKHVNSRLEGTRPGEAENINLLFASPECTHHSRARGGKPTSDQQRSGAWHVLPWIEYHRPSWVVIENVSEFKEWGPVDSKGRPIQSYRGKFFDAWLMAIRAAGYRVDLQKLNAANFGAATSRNRLFVVARKGNRNPLFPEPTHSRRTGGELPGMGLKPWKAAADVIDWSIPCPSIFGRQRPLADKTLLRIEAGLRRFVGPFVAQWDNQSGGGSGTRDVSDPLFTMVTKANMGIALPYQVVFRNHQNASDVGEPLSTICTSGAHHGLAMPYIVPNFGERDGQQARTHSLGDPVPCVTSHGAGCVAVPFVSSYHCGEDSARRNHGQNEPLPTIDTSNRYAVVTPFLADTNHGLDGHTNGRTHSLDNPLGAATGQNGKALVTPFMLATGSGGAPRSVDQPTPTIVTRDGTALATPFMCGCGGRAGQSPPRSTDGPMGTITTKADSCLAVPYQFQLIGRGAGKSRSASDPVPTIVAARENHGVAVPWLGHYYGTDNQSPVADPVDTITTKARHSLCVAICRGPQDWPTPQSDAMRKLQATMLELGVCDIGFRMLSNPELSAAQGFDHDYIFHGTKAEITRQIGNSVSPNVAKAITQAILSV